MIKSKSEETNKYQYMEISDEARKENKYYSTYI